MKFKDSTKAADDAARAAKEDIRPGKDYEGYEEFRHEGDGFVIWDKEPKDSRLAQFMEEWKGVEKELPEGVMLHVVKDVRGDHKSIDIALIEVSPDQRGKGEASKAIKKLTDLADKHDVIVTMNPEAKKDSSLTTDQLEAWYERYGWQEHSEYSHFLRRPQKQRTTRPKPTTPDQTLGMKFKEWLIKESAEDLLQNAEKLADMSCDDVEELLFQGGGMSDWDDRAKFASKYSWSIPCKDAIDAIKKWARPPLYDLMAGTGFWAKILNKRGVSTIASDIHKFSKFNLYHKEHIKKHYKIRRRHALKAVQDIERARETQEIAGDILLGWPPYLETTAFEVLSRLPIGVRVFYFGEGEMGATGDLAMHTSFSRNFKALDHIYMPNFMGIHDQLVIYEKIKDEEIDPKFKGIMAKFNLDDNE